MRARDVWWIILFYIYSGFTLSQTRIFELCFILFRFFFHDLQAS